ncbi:MAG TPA: M23 family metallopeptidase [Candidatus Limnocylindria bacterium]|nr:M23 family metallopeptidase [Candidatus Limnocylindria bacterium]
MRATLTKRSTTPSIGRQQLGTAARRAGGNIERILQIAARQVGRRALFLLVNLLVAAIVVALPFIANGSPHAAALTDTAPAPIGSTSLAPADGEPAVARVAPPARGGTIAAGRNPVTVQAAGEAPIVEYTLSTADTLWSIANFYGISAEAVAFANGITDPYHLQVGRKIMIPPLEGALYTVADGDTVESVAQRFKVDPAVIKDYNRLWLEPERFAPGKLIFVRNAALPTLPPPPDANATVIARPATSAPDAKAGGYLPWPVAGWISQYFWAGHTGVDIAAPYGSGLAASVNGVISQNGWVAVGGLHICVKSGNLEECYYHLSAAYLPVGTPVSAGQIVAAIGLTGVTTGPHVHWETKIDGHFVNPLAVQP